MSAGIVFESCASYVVGRCDCAVWLLFTLRWEYGPPRGCAQIRDYAEKIVRGDADPAQKTAEVQSL